MVHVSDTPIPLPEILDQLRAGDIATHVFNANAERVLGADGSVRPEVRAAEVKTERRFRTRHVVGAGGAVVMGTADADVL